MRSSVEKKTPSPVKVLRRTSTASSLEDGAFALVLPVLAEQSTGKYGVAAVFVAVTAPWALASLPIGYLADHMSRTRLLRIAAVVRTGLAALLAALHLFGSPAPGLVAVVAFGLGSCAVASEIARQSLVPQLVSKPDQLVSANTEIAKVSQLYGGFVGPLVGGALLTWSQSGATIALAMFALITLIVTLGLPETPALRDEPMRVQTMVTVGLDGFRHIYRQRTLLTLAALSFTVSAIWYVWQTSFTAFALADNGLGASSLGYSVLLLAGDSGSARRQPTGAARDADVSLAHRVVHEPGRLGRLVRRSRSDIELVRDPRLPRPGRFRRAAVEHRLHHGSATRHRGPSVGSYDRRLPDGDAHGSGDRGGHRRTDDDAHLMAAHLRHLCRCRRGRGCRNPGSLP